MSLQKWKLLKEEDVSPSKWFPLFKHTAELPNGKIVDDYYVAKLGDLSTIIAITESQKILFVKQYKHGVLDLMIELPAGRIRPGLTPLEAAKKEFKEETGFLADKFIEIGYVIPIPSKDPSKVFGFIATGLKDKSETEFDENEDIEILQLSVNEIDEMIKNGEITGSDAIALYYKAKLMFPQLF